MPASLPPGFTCRALKREDGPAVAAVQEASYPPHYHEDVSFVLERAEAFPEGSFVVVDDSNGQVVAYAQCYPWPREAALKKPPSLHDGDAVASIRSALTGPKEDAILFAHEVTVWEQGKGLGSFLMERLLAVSEEGRRFDLVMLVAVLGNGPLWGRFGFEALKELPWGYYASESESSEEGADAAPPTTRLGLAPRPSFFSKDLSAVVMTKKVMAMAVAAAT